MPTIEKSDAPNVLARRLSDRFAGASFDSMEGVPAWGPVESGASFPRRLIATFKRLAPGLGIAVLIALAASWLAEHYTAIHDVAQVVGAGYGVSELTGDTSTIVKLFRVALLLPAALFVSLMFRDRKSKVRHGARPPLLPAFLLVFVALVALNSVITVPAELVQGAGDASRWCLVIAIAGLGIKTKLGDFVKVGWRPAALILAETLFVMLLVLTLLLTV